MAEGTRTAQTPPDRLTGAGRAPVRAYTRPKTTPRRVVLVDRIADWTISVGGLAVIVAVFGIMAFLVEVVIPLFLGASVSEAHTYALPAAPSAPLAFATDEYNTLGLELSPDGRVRSFHLATGLPVSEEQVELGASEVTAFARTLRGGHVIFGFADGSVRFGRISVDASVLREQDLPSPLRPIGGGDRTDGRAVYSPVPGQQYRRVAPALELLELEPGSPGAQPILALDYRVGGSVERPTRTFVAVDAAGEAVLTRIESRMNLLTRKLTSQRSETRLPRVRSTQDLVRVLMNELGDEVFLAWRDGTVQRLDLRDFAHPVLAEERDLLPGDARLGSVGFLIGEQSLVVGSSDGSVDVYFRVERADAGTSDGRTLVLAHRLEPHAGAVTAFSASQRSKLFLTGDERGDVWLRHATSERVLLRLEQELAAGVETLALSARDDGLLAIDAARSAAHWRVEVPHPETTFATIFGKVWYEGYPEPTYTWQSSSGTDVFEPKFSLVPLVFGTLKATVYSLLFAIPLALLAAIYTSEFVHPRVRAVVKPAMEMMASLPSVVLGFIAALVLAPVVETWIASVLLAFFVLPLSLLAGAYLWQLLPQRVALRLEGMPKLALLFATVGLGGWLAWRLGPRFEAALFGGDFRLWLDGRFGSGQPLLFLLLLPLTFLGASWGLARVTGGFLEERMRSLTRGRAGLLDAARWLALLFASGGLAWGAAGALAALGLDLRGGPVGTYVQRNTLVVGFAMGFAVIPIIYTIAEDAMSAVPAHLRAASLACGATAWQTAISVIMPTAMSGIFAAVMIGMGRAVGETMIVVMAAGNTPILDWNVFNGLRALSANIAVELPEAVKDGSLYRMLFLAALTLFGMTFAVNTLAEIVRLRFRRRAAEL